MGGKVSEWGARRGRGGRASASPHIFCAGIFWAVLSAANLFCVEASLSPSPSGSSVTPCESGAENSAAVPDFWLGIVASLFGSIILNLGMNIQKYAFQKRSEILAQQRQQVKEQKNFTASTKVSPKAYEGAVEDVGVMSSSVVPSFLPPIYKDPMWVLGLALFTLGNFGDVVGLAFTPQSVITPIGSVSLVSNLIFAHLLLGEKLDRRTLGAVGLILIGVLCIVSSSSASQKCSGSDVEELISRWTQPLFLVFAVILAIFQGTLFVSVRMTEKRMQGSIRNLAPPLRRRLRLFYPLIAACFASWTVLLTKSIGELVLTSVRAQSMLFMRWEALFIFMALLISIPCQVVYINKGLAYFEALFVVPIFYSCWVIMSITMGALFWGEFHGFLEWQLAIFFVGVALDVAGGSMLQARKIVAKGAAEDTGDSGLQRRNEAGISLEMVPRYIFDRVSEPATPWYESSPSVPEIIV